MFALAVIEIEACLLSQDANSSQFTDGNEILSQDHEVLIRKTMSFFEANCEKNLSLELLAERVDLSPYHFHRLFRACARQPLGEFVRQFWLQKGARLLV